MKSGIEYLKLLIISCLLFNVAMAMQWQKATASCSSEYHLPVTITDCQHYDIRIMPSLISNHHDYDNHYYGDISYTIKIYRITRSISLHASSELYISNTTSLVQYSPHMILTPVKYFYCNKTEILMIVFDSELSPGKYALNLRFTGMLTTPYENGFTSITYTDNTGVAKKLLMMNFLWNARTVFPCWDEPALKATFDIAVKHSLSYHVLSNMPIQEKVRINDDMMWTYFYTTPLISTHLVGIVIFNDILVSIFNDDMSIAVWGDSRKLWELQSMYEIAEKCSNYINMNTHLTKILKMDHVAIPSPTHLMKYSWGLYTYKESELSYNQESKNIKTGDYMEYQIAHKVAHQLFRGMISPTWWNYEPLNDGIATLFALYVINELLGRTQFLNYFVVEMQHQLLSEDVNSYMSPVIREVNTSEEIESFLLSSSRKKATAIMRMMSHIVSNEFFMGAVSRYWHNNASQSVSLDDLWEAFEGIPMSFAKFDGYDLKTVMTNWLFNNDYPVVYVDSISSRDLITVTQECFCKQTADKDDADKLWWIPITYTHKSIPVFNETSPIFWLNPNISSREIYDVPEDDWIIVNVQQTGYYRVNYDIINWRKLAIYLNSDEYTKIHPINRAQIIDDSYHLMLKGSLDPRLFLELSIYLERERDYVPWYPMKKIVWDMLTFFQFPESKLIKQHITTILYGVLKDVGFDERNNETDFIRRLRLLVVELACQIGLTDCLNEANAKLSEYLDYSQTHRHTILPSWRNWILCTGMMKANMYYWEKMLDLFLRTANIQYLEYLICADDPVIIISYIEKLMSNYIPLFSPEDSTRIIHFIIRRHAKKDAVFAYVLMNFNRIEPYQGLTILEVTAQSIYSSEHFRQLKEFIAIYCDHTQTMVPINWQPTWRFKKDYSKQLISIITERLKQIQQEINVYVDLFSDLLRIPRSSFTYF